MARVKISIIGTPEKEPRIQENRSVDLVFIAQQSSGIPKGLEPLRDCPCFVHVAPQQWENLQGQGSQPAKKLCISGEVAPRVNKNGMLFLEVVALDIGFVERAEPQGEQQEQAAKKASPVPPPREQPKIKLTPVEGTVKVVELTRIRLPEGLESPSPLEVQEAARFIWVHKRFEKPLLVDKSNRLLEGYVWYLAAQELSLERVPIAYPKKTPRASAAILPQAEAPSAQPKPVFDVPVPAGTEELLELAQIQVPERFTPPNPEGIKEVMAYVEEKKTLDKPLWVKKESHMLLDGYKQYLAAKELQIERVPITYTKPPETEKFQKGQASEYQPRAKAIPWYTPTDVVQVKVSDIQLTETIHCQTMNISLHKPLRAYSRHEEEQLSPIVLRRLDDGTYSLVTGIQRYFVARILGWEHLPAVLTELAHDAFMQERGWVERPTPLPPVRGKR